MSEVAAVDTKLEVSSDARDAVDEITSGCAVDVKTSELIVTVGSTVVTALTTTVEGDNVVVLGQPKIILHIQGCRYS